MKKFTLVLAAAAGIICFTEFMIPGSSTVVQGEKAIPRGVHKVIEGSCINCHVEPGKKLAMMRVNLSEWNDYSAEQQAKKSRAMCRMVTKGKMPPKKYRENHPDFVLTSDEIKTICDWAESLQVSNQKPETGD